MAPSAATSGSDASTPAPAPFSYAQAAKGRISTSSASAPTPVPSAQGKKENGKWPDDSSDTPTAVDERRQSDLANGTASRDGEAKSTSSPLPSESNVSPSHPPSPHYDSSATTAKEDDVNSPAKISSDSPWTQKSSLPNGERHQEPNPDNTNGSQDDANEATDIQSASQLMKEAPVPTINFWTKRAEELKAKQAQAKPAQQVSPTTQVGAPASAPPAQHAKPRVAEGVPDLPKKSKSDDQSSSAKESQDSSVLSSNKPRGTKNARSQKQDSVQPKSVPLPSVRDETAWPTPLTAQDEDRRKAQDKVDKDRPLSANPKPHGKNEWVQIPYTPSVKFNTPLPQTRGRGGRGGSRGGRGGSFSERSGVPGAAPTTKDDTTNTENRGRSAGSVSKSANHSPVDSRTASANQAASTDKVPPTNGQGKRLSYSKSQGQPKNNQTDQTPRNQSVSPSEVNGTSQHATTRGDGATQQKAKQTSTTSELAARRRSSVVPFENSTAAAQPVPPKRRSPSGIDQPEITSDESSRAVSDSLPATQNRIFTDSRSTPSTRYSDGGRDTWGSLPFRDNRAERGGRGRGGRGNTFSLPHHAANQHQSNSSLPPIQTNNTFAPKSATLQSQPFPPVHQSFSEYRSSRSGPRSASIPTENPYQRYAQTYPSSAQFAVYPSYYNTVYDYNAAPMSAIPYTPQMDQALLIQAIAFQLNYYFSLENLLKDMFLRKHMDSQGFVPLSLIANFKRMKDLTTDLDLIQFACTQSTELEFRNAEDNQPKIRRKEDWDKWVLSMEDRDPSAQHEGPARRESATMTPMPGFGSQQGMRSPFPEMNSSGLDGSVGAFGMTPSFQPVPISSPIDGARSPRDLSARHSLPALGTDSVHSQYASPDLSSNDRTEYGQEEVDSFPNEQIPFLTVAVRPYTSTTARQQPKPEASRTFSNGSISMEELKSTDGGEANSQTSHDEQGDTDPLQKVLSTRKKMSTPSSQSSTKLGDSVELFWFKGEESRQQPLPSNGNSELYIQLHYKALEERQHAESGKCPHDMDVLYQFWSHFLIRNFNTTMYNEFRQLAHDDAAQDLSDNGLQNLITFYSEALSSQQPIRDRVARHYVSLVKNEDPSKGRPAFEQLRAAWRNGALNMKNRKRISTYVDRELRDELDK